MARGARLDGARDDVEFDQFAENYRQVLDRGVAASGEDSTYFAEYKARYLGRVLPRDFRGTILDFGCGIGLLANFLSRHFPESRLDGYDPSSESLANVDPDLARRGTFRSRLDQLGNAYDLIVVANVLHHVPPGERPKILAELAGRLAPGGRVAMFEHNPWNPATRWMVERCAFDKDAVLLPAGEAVGCFLSAQLEVERRDYIVFMPHFAAWLRRLEPWLAWLPMGAQYAVVGRRRT
jgi:SAM-dependent methyltransferase